MENNSAISSDVDLIGRLTVVPTILQVVAHTTGMRFTAVARVTETSWTACAVYDHINFGLKPGGELALESTICNEIRQHHRPVVFGHASEHPEFSTHPTPKMYGFESYVSIPIFRSGGEFWGTLCAIDPLPAKLDDPNVVKSLELFAQLIAAQMENEERLEKVGIDLSNAHEAAKLREQFIAVLGHDLRNPLNAIAVSSQVLLATLTDSRALTMAGTIKRSCARMAELIQNVLDFARGRLGGGIPVSLRSEDQLADEFRHVIAEVETIFPDRTIEVALALNQPVLCDRSRMGQLLANLLTNAVVHGAADVPIRVAASNSEETFTLDVSNGGDAIDEQTLARLFQPFTRSSRPQDGLGLGLYIAAEIAKAHGGELKVLSSPGEGTTFSFVLTTLGVAA
jgi:signal transduction histidine kinase